MSRVSNTTAATLRRRSARLRAIDDVAFDRQFTEVLDRAADQLDMLTRAARGDTQAALEAIGDNRRLRRLLVDLWNGTDHPGLAAYSRDELRRRIDHALRGDGRPSVSEGRTLLVYELDGTPPRAEVEEFLKAALDQHYAVAAGGEPGPLCAPDVAALVRATNALLEVAVWDDDYVDAKSFMPAYEQALDAVRAVAGRVGIKLEEATDGEEGDEAARAASASERKAGAVGAHAGVAAPDRGRRRSRGRSGREADRSPGAEGPTADGSDAGDGTVGSSGITSGSGTGPGGGTA